MPNCNHEEPDTRIAVHLLHSVQRGNKKILVKTVDGDIIVILLGKFKEISHSCSDIDLWIAFGVGKDFALCSIKAIYEEIGTDTAQALPVFDAFSGCDTTFSFHEKGKRSVWEAWKSFPKVTSAFLFIAENACKTVNITSPYFMTLKRFKVILYDNTSDLNQSRRELFCKKKTEV